jgi:hypothetical protein
MDENEYYRSLKDKVLSPNLVFLFAVNIPNDIELPGVGSLSAEEAQSFTPIADDESLDNSPLIDYPINILFSPANSDGVRKQQSYKIVEQSLRSN